MDIKYKDDKVEISIKNINKNSILVDSELNSVVKIIEILRDFNGEIKTGLTNIIKEQKKENKESLKDSKPVVRDRLPNQVDLSELDIKKAMTTEPMIRCPSCGQSSKAIIHIEKDKNYFIRKIKKGNKETFETFLALDEEETKKIKRPIPSRIIDYHDDIMKIKAQKDLVNTDINVKADTMVLCPVCACLNDFSNWVDAYEHPLEHGFETENLCEICGAEAVETIDKNKKKVIKCESCGFTKPML